MKTGIGAVVITRNEEGVLEDCLRSLEFCDERVVVDSFSTDETVAIACAHAEHVYQRTFVGFADQKQWAIDRLETPWALVVDADERVAPELAREMTEGVRADATDGFELRRQNFFFGRWIRGAGWQRDRVLRLARRDHVELGDRLVHEELVLRPGSRVQRCRAPLEHLSYRDWPSTFERLLSYTSKGAAERARRGQRPSAWRVGTKPLARFLRQYVLQQGWRDGVHGYVLCAFGAIGVFLREAKLRAGEFGMERAPRAVVRVEVVQGRGLGEAREQSEPPRDGGAEQDEG